MPPRHIDLRHEQRDPLPPTYGLVNGVMTRQNKCLRGKDGKVVKRDMALITGITIHQTACVFGSPNPRDKDARYRRALDVPCHALGFMDGVFVTPSPLSWYLYHGNALNEHDLGLELEGHFAGLADDPTTPRREDIESTWKGKEPTPLTPLMIETYRAELKWLVDKAREEGAKNLRYVHAHRQSNGIKNSDPGELLWKAIVEDYGIPVLGLEPQYALTLRDGLPIPKAWAKHGVGPYRRA